MLVVDGGAHVGEQGGVLAGVGHKLDRITKMIRIHYNVGLKLF